MANLEVLALDTSVPQIRAPGVGDGYSVPRDMTMESGTTLSVQTLNAPTQTASSVMLTDASKNLTTVPVLTVPNGGTGASTVTGILKGNGALAFSAATAGTDYLVPPSGTAILKANSGAALANATAGTDYVAPGTATTFTATQTFSGTSSTLGAVLTDAAETVTVSATAATGTIAYDVTTQSVLFYTSNAAANWTVNFRGSAGTSLNTLLSTGQAITVAFLVTNGATPYYNTTVQVDGTTSGVTTRWQGGTAPSSGNASSVDVYSYTVIKTAAATFSVFAAQTRFA
jgi:hypothetical protein